MTHEEHQAIVQPVEQAIQKLLLNLDEALSERGRKIDMIEADTRRFASMTVTIMTTPT